jgi:hypothetical protein
MCDSESEVSNRHHSLSVAKKNQRNKKKRMKFSLLVPIAMVVATCACVLGDVVYSNPSSFCETWASPNNSTGQISLVTYIVNNALFGNMSETTGDAPVPGLLNVNSVQGALNGSLGGSNYIVAGAAQDALVLNLNLLFQKRFGCRALTPVAADIQVLSFALNNSNVYAVLEQQTILAVISYGVPALALAPTVSEVTFISAVFDSMQLGAVNSSICSSSNCTYYSPLAQFNSASNSSVPSYFVTNDNTTNMINITTGTAVNWRMLYAVYQVVETDVNNTILVGGRSSAAYNTTTFTLTFTTPGTFYFASGIASTAKSVVVVTQAPIIPVVVPPVPVPVIVVTPKKETTVAETVGVSSAALITAVVAGMMFFKTSL